MKYISIIFVFVMLFALLSAYTVSFAQTDWNNRSQNPVLEPGDPGEWDDGLVASPSILFDGMTYHMWYVGGHDETLLNIGYAFSFDGISWTKDTLNNPALEVGASGSWEETWVYFPTVIYDPDSLKFHMWYVGTHGNPTTGQNWAERIGHASSSNGYNWLKDTLNPVLELGQAGSWEDYLVSTPFVRFDDTTYHMWYTGGDGSENYKIGHATSLSVDGNTWTKDSVNNPILFGGSFGNWDYPRVQDPRVLFDGTIYHMWYSGGGMFTWQIGHATSSDGITWAKDTANLPVLPRGIAGFWDDQFVTSCSVILDTSSGDPIYKMWYGGGNANWDAHIGYATAPFTGIKLLDVDLPNDYVLRQNYPNPFNPTTNIEFSIPKTEFVTLKVYNILGEEVATLVSERLVAGRNKYDWDASGFASGVYLYNLKTDGGFMETKKLILLK